MNEPIGTVLVTGATGYIGGRLVPHLLERGYSVRVLARDPSRLHGRRWLSQVEVFQGDVLKPETLLPALKGAQAAYYLVHSMKGGSDFHERDLKAARGFAEAAGEVGLDRIIYLGGLGTWVASGTRARNFRRICAPGSKPVTLCAPTGFP